MDNMDDRYDDVRYDADDRYDDNRYNRQDDARTRADHERRMHDAVARAAADAAVNTARRMTNNTRSDMPVMTHNDTRNDARYDADTTADRPGPGMRR